MGSTDRQDQGPRQRAAGNVKQAVGKAVGSRRMEVDGTVPGAQGRSPAGPRQGEGRDQARHRQGLSEARHSMRQAGDRKIAGLVVRSQRKRSGAAMTTQPDHDGPVGDSLGLHFRPHAHGLRRRWHRNRRATAPCRSRAAASIWRDMPGSGSNRGATRAAFQRGCEGVTARYAPQPTARSKSSTPVGRGPSTAPDAASPDGPASWKVRATPS